MPFPHPAVTIYRGKDGWRAVYRSPKDKEHHVISFRKLGILTAKGRRAWAVRKSNNLMRGWAARMRRDKGGRA